MKKTLYLHIGTYKTGTTSLQNYLAEHSSWLKEQGYLVPKIRLSHPFRHWPLSQSIVKSFADSPNAPWLGFTGDMRKEWQNFHKEVEESNCSNIILSSECFCDFAHQACIHNSNEMILWLKKQIDYLDVKIICYVRELDKYYISFYKELIKTRPIHQPTLESHIKRSIEHGSFHTAPTKYLDLFSKTFGKRNLTVRKYNKNDLIKGNTIDDFLSLIGLSSRPPLVSETESNPSLPNELVDIKRAINLIGINNPNKNRLITKSLLDLTRPAFTRPPDDGEAIRSTLQKEHEAIAENYGIDLGEVGDLFADAPETSISEQGTRLMVAMLWQEVRQLRAQVNKMARSTTVQQRRGLLRRIKDKLYNNEGNL